MSKAFKENDKWLQIVVTVIIVGIMVVFTWVGLIDKQPCDIDEQYLWCRLHPASLLQKIGVGGFYITCLILTGAWGKWVQLWNPENSTRWNFIFLIFGVLSILAMWFG